MAMAPNNLQELKFSKRFRFSSNMMLCGCLDKGPKQPRTKKTGSDEAFRNGHFFCPFGIGLKLWSAEGLGIHNM